MNLKRFERLGLNVMLTAMGLMGLSLFLLAFGIVFKIMLVIASFIFAVAMALAALSLIPLLISLFQFTKESDVFS